MTYLAAMCAVMVGVAVPLRASGVAAEQGALALALLGALVLMAANGEMRTEVHGVITSTAGKLVASIFVIWTLTTLFSPDMMGSLEIGGRTGLFLLASVLVWAALIVHRNQHSLLWKALIVSALLFSVASLAALNGMPEVASLLTGKGLAYTYPPTALKAFAASALCLIPVVAWAGRRLDGNWRWLGYSFAPLALMVIIQTYNRAALAGFIIMAFSGVLLVVLTQRKHVKIILASTGAGITGAFAWLYSKEVNQPVIDGVYMPEWLVDPHRQHIWKFAFDHFLEKPWFGNGIDQLNKLAGANEPVPGLASSAAFIPSHPHNWILELLSETGIIGFLPILLALGFIVWKILVRFLRDDDEADLALLALMAGFWSSALFNFSIWAAWWQLTLFILFAVIASTRPRPQV